MNDPRIAGYRVWVDNVRMELIDGLGRLANSL